MTWLDLESDRAFGPQFRDKFDFTLEFEHTILSILPASLFLAGAPVFFLLYQHSPNIVLSGKLLWVKLATAIAIIGVEIASLGLWSNSGERASESAIAAATVLVAAALCLAPMIYWEHRRTLQSTSFIAIWLIISALCDIIRSRSLFLRPGLDNVGILAVVAAALKLFTLGLEEVSKASLIADERTRKDTGKEATSGFLSRTLFVWINRMFFFGFKNILRLDTLDSLGPAFRSQYLSDHLNLFWAANDGSVSGSLEVACVRANLGSWLSSILPRLCQGVFTVSQPLLLKSVVSYVESNEKTTGRRDGLIVAAAVIYTGLALSKVSYDHICYQIATQIRGMLVSQTSKKSLKLKYPEAQNTSIITLMNVDMKNIATGIPRVHSLWISVLQTAVNLYVLTGLVKAATVLVVGPVLLSIAGTYWVGKHMPSAQKLWVAAIATRVKKTTKMLSQIKAVKMTGLEDVMTTYVQGLRETEVEYSKQARTWLLRNYVIGTFCDCITSPVVLAGGIFWTGLGGDFTPSNVFTTLATVTLIGSTLKYLPDEFGYIQTARASLDRFEQYLALEERQDPRYSDLAAFSAEVARSKANEEVVEEIKVVRTEAERPASRVIEFYKAEIAVEGTEKAILPEVTVTIERRELVMVVGPTGGGKSTLLRAILGEIELLGGSLYVEAGFIAYCDQTAWIWNASIQVNIIGNSPVDMGWYDSVLEACLLKPDLRRLPQGDQTMVGSNGGNLSGGQKQRVALARAVHTRSPILVMDDILSALDRQTAAEIFSRLFGPDGLLKRSSTTVIMATHSIQFLGAADRILHVGEKGAVTTRTDVDEFVSSDDIQEICQKISAARAQNEDVEDEDEDEEVFEFKAAEPVVMDDDIARQKGDLTIYTFYARTFQLFHSICWFIFMFMTAVGEVLSDGYVRIWMELDPYNRLWYIGYVLIGSSAAFFMLLNTRTLFLRLLPYSSLYIHRMLLDVVMRARLSFLTGTDHGSLVNRISQDLTMVSQQLPEGGMRVIYYCCRMLLRIGLIIAVTTYTVIILPFLIAAMYFVQLFYLRTSRQLRYLELETGAPLCAQFTESAVGLYHIRAFGWQHHNLDVSLQLLDDSQKPFYYMYAAERWLGLVMDTITLVLALTVIIVTLCVQQITSASGIALSMLSLITLSYESMMFVRQWMLVETSIGALARTRDFVLNTPLEEDPDVTTKTVRAWPEEGAIVMDHVVARYSDGAPAVLDDISLDIAPRTKVGIVGRTGGGKSSILMTLLGFLDYEGKITIDGIDISRIPRKKLRSVVTVISQDDLEFDGTVRYNLCPNPNDENAKMPFNEAALVELLHRLELLELLDEHDPLGTEMSTLGLSHGQKQLMSIARSCIRNYTFNTRIIIMDEATSNLDPDKEQLVLQVFEELFFDCTVITVAHRTETLEDTDMNVKISNGRIASIRYPKQENEASSSSSAGPSTPTAQAAPPTSPTAQAAPTPTCPAAQPASYPTAQPVPSPAAQPVPFPTALRSPNPDEDYLSRPVPQLPRVQRPANFRWPPRNHPEPTPETQPPYEPPQPPHPPQAPPRPVSLPRNHIVEELLRRAREYKDPGQIYNEVYGIGVAGRLAARARGQVDRLREMARIQAEEEENAKAKRDAKIAQKREIDEARRKRKADKAERKAKGRARWGKSDPVTEGAGEGRAPVEVVEKGEKVVEKKVHEKDGREVEETVQEGDQEEFDEKGKGKIV